MQSWTPKQRWRRGGYTRDYEYHINQLPTGICQPQVDLHFRVLRYHPYHIQLQVVNMLCIIHIPSMAELGKKTWVDHGYTLMANIQKAIEHASFSSLIYPLKIHGTFYSFSFDVSPQVNFFKPYDSKSWDFGQRIPKSQGEMKDSASSKHTRWGPPVIRWFINPINYSYRYHKP